MENVTTNQAMFGRNVAYATSIGAGWRNINTAGATAIRMYDDPGDASIGFHLHGSETAGTSLTSWDTTDLKMTIRNSGNVGIGTAAPAYKLHVIGDIGINQPSAISFANGQTIRDNGSGGLGIASGASINNTVAGGGFYTINGGNVGIGTTSPAALLHVNGAIVSYGGGTSGYVSLQAGNASVQGYVEWYKPGPTRVGYMGYNDGSTANNICLTLENSAKFIVNGGNVGINTTSPGYKLEVNGDSSAIGSFKVRNASYLSSYHTSLRSDSGAVGVLQLGNNNDNYILAGNTNANGYLVIRVNCTTESITSGTEAMRITSGGNVGIGTTSPLNLLHLENGNSTFTTPASTNVPNLYIYNSNSASITAHSLLTLRTNNTGGGNPFISFDINQVRGYAMGIDNADDDKFKINYGWNSLSSDTKITLQYNGNVGIGTTAPAYALEVVGTIRASSDVIAYSDARVKENVNTITDALTKVTSLRGVTYTRNDMDDKSEKIGVIAQEVLPILPQVVQQDNNGNYSVAYGNIVGVLIEAIKELKAEIDILKQK